MHRTLMIKHFERHLLWIIVSDQYSGCEEDSGCASACTEPEGTTDKIDKTTWRLNDCRKNTLSNEISKYAGTLSKSNNYLIMYVMRTLYFGMVGSA